MSSTATTPSTAAPTLRDTHALRMLLRCYGYLRPYWRTELGAYLALLAINSLSIYIPQVLRDVVDLGLIPGNTRYVSTAVLTLLGLALVKGVITFFQQRWLEVASQNVAYDLRNDIQTKLTDLSFSYHDQTEAGQLLSRAIQDVERIP
jgi:ATP-binding cassette subfamily B protein